MSNSIQEELFMEECKEWFYCVDVSVRTDRKYELEISMRDMENAKKVSRYLQDRNIPVSAIYWDDLGYTLFADF